MSFKMVIVSLAYLLNVLNILKSYKVNYYTVLLITVLYTAAIINVYVSLITKNLLVKTQGIVYTFVYMLFRVNAVFVMLHRFINKTMHPIFGSRYKSALQVALGN